MKYNSQMVYGFLIRKYMNVNSMLTKYKILLKSMKALRASSQTYAYSQADWYFGGEVAGLEL